MAGLLFLNNSSAFACQHSERLLIESFLKISIINYKLSDAIYQIDLYNVHNHKYVLQIKYQYNGYMFHNSSTITTKISASH